MGYESVQLHQVDASTRYEAQVDELLAYASDLPELFVLRSNLVSMVMDRIDTEGELA